MGDAAPLRLKFDAFELDERNVRLTRDGRPVVLTPKAFAVLCELARRRGDLVGKNALLDAVWGHQHVSESVLKTIISQLRSALADDPKHPRYIETVSRHGYRFIAPLRAAPAESATPDSHLMPAEAPPLIGRAAALDTLRRCWNRTLAGQRQLVWVVGDAGVGKTMLIEHFARELPPEAVVVSRCVEHFGAGEPYLPLLEALNEHCRREPELAGIMRTVAPTWLVQMPWLISEEDRAKLHRELAGAHPDRMVRELGELMKRYTEQKPFLLVLEDLHWSDLGTLRMMEHFARQPRQFRFMWIGSFRLTQVIADEHPLKSLRQELRLHRLYEEIILDPFSESEVDAYLGARLPGSTFRESFVRRLHGQTDGLPLFVANVADTLLAEPLTGDAEDRLVVADLPLPESLAGVLEKQVARLAPELATLLDAASICGAEFRAEMLAAVLQQDAATVCTQCDDLVRRQLWLRPLPFPDLPEGDLDARYGFLHALYRHFFYQRLFASRRASYHRLAAAWIRQARAAGRAIPPTELASHLERGREMVAAMEAYEEAAGLALIHFAPSDAQSLSDRGLSLLDHCRDETRRSELELSLRRHRGVARSLLYGVASDDARTDFERMRVLCDKLPPDPRRAMVLNGLGWMHFVAAEFEEALSLAQRLLDTAEEYDDAALFLFGCNLRGVTLVWMGELETACEWLQRGLDFWLRAGEPIRLESFVVDPEVSIRGNLAVPLADRGLIDQALSHSRLAIERADRIGQPIARMLANWVACQLWLRLDQPERVAQHAAVIAEVVESAMLGHGEGPSLWMRGWAEARLGDPRGGHRHILEGYARSIRADMYAGSTEVLAYSTEALILAGDFAGATAQLEEAFALAARIGERLALPRLFLHQAQVALATGNAAAAEAPIRAALAEARAQKAHDIELKALLTLFEAGLSGDSDALDLRTACGNRREGRDTPVYRRAEELIALPA